MKSFSLPFSYLLWHYTTAWTDILRLYRNFSWFLWNFFSIRILSETLFSPWHRIHERPDKDTAGMLGSFILNSLLRLIGFVARTFTILFGFLALGLFSIVFLVFLALWPFIPFFIVALLISGITGLIAF